MAITFFYTALRMSHFGRFPAAVLQTVLQDLPESLERVIQS
jgi:hypothetical protein